MEVVARSRWTEEDIDTAVSVGRDPPVEAVEGRTRAVAANAPFMLATVDPTHPS